MCWIYLLQIRWWWAVNPHPLNLFATRPGLCGCAALNSQMNSAQYSSQSGKYCTHMSPSIVNDPRLILGQNGPSSKTVGSDADYSGQRENNILRGKQRGLIPKWALKSDGEECCVTIRLVRPVIVHSYVWPGMVVLRERVRQTGRGFSWGHVLGKDQAGWDKHPSP